MNTECRKALKGRNISALGIAQGAIGNNGKALKGRNTLTNVNTTGRFAIFILVNFEMRNALKWQNLLAEGGQRPGVLART